MERKNNTNIQGEDCEKARIKEEQSETFSEECNMSSDVDTKIGFKQETYDPNVVLGDIKSDTEQSSNFDPVPFIDAGTVKGSDENIIYIKEEFKWCDETSADYQNEEMVTAPSVDVSARDLPSTSWPCAEAVYSSGVTEQQNHGDNGSLPVKSNISAEISDEKYQCKTRGKRYKSSHLKKHNDKRQYKCELCGKSFKQLYCLKTHLLVHDDQKQFKCEICGKSFKWLQNLKPHLLTHGDKRQYKCEICGKRFKQLAGLKTHLLVHDDKRQYTCGICEKSFKRCTVLKRHLLIHNEIREYKCDICGKTFTQLNNLKTHLVIHDNKRQHQCNVCGRSFKLSQHLKRHLLLHNDKQQH